MIGLEKIIRMEKNKITEKFNPKSMKDLENSFFSGGITKFNEIVGYLEKIDMTDQGKFLLDLYHGMSEHENANFALGRLHGCIGKQKITREETAEITHKFLEKNKEIEEAESKAIELYKKALVEWKKNSTLVHDFVVLSIICDLEYRKAQRIEKEKERKSELANVDEDYQRLVDMMDKTGHKTELQVVCLLRKWAEKEKIDHLISINHSTIVEDLKDGVDIVITCADIVINVSVKSYTRSRVDKKQMLDIVDKIKRESGSRRFVPLIVDNKDVNDVYENQKKSNRISDRSVAILNEIASSVKKEMETMGMNFFKKPKNLTLKMIEQKYSTVSILVELGFLEEEDKNDATAIMDAKDRLLKKAKGNSKSAKDIRQRIQKIVNFY